MSNDLEVSPGECDDCGEEPGWYECEPCAVTVCESCYDAEHQDCKDE